MAEELRKTQRLNDEEWVDIDFVDLKEGDIFRLFEPTGEPVRDEEGYDIFQAFSPLETEENGVLMVDARPVRKTEGE